MICPLFADQGANARALENLGVALVVEPTGISAAERATYDPGTVGVLRGAVERVLQNGRPRTAARAVAAELGRRPTPAQLLLRLSAR